MNSFSFNRRTSRQRGVVGMEIVVGAVAAAIGAAVWAGIVVLTGYEVGYVAWGIGLLVGAAVAAVAKTPNAGHGIVAVGLVVASLLVAKLLIVQWGVPSAAAKEYVADPEYMMEAVFYDDAVNGRMDAAVSQWYLDPAAPPTPPAEIESQVEAASLAAAGRLADMDDGEKESVARAFAAYNIGQIPYGERIKLTLSGWDALWFGLAMLTAWQVGAGRAGQRDTAEA